MILTQYKYCQTNEEALKEAKLGRLGGKRVQIISDAEYARIRPKLAEIQDIPKWAKDNNVE